VAARSKKEKQGDLLR